MPTRIDESVQPDICDHLRDLLAKASPRPWSVQFEEAYQVIRHSDDRCVCEMLVPNDDYPGELEAANAHLIVAAVNDLPVLLDELGELRRQLQEPAVELEEVIR